MEIKVLKNDDGIFLVELTGSLDLSSSNELKDLIMKMIENKSEQFIISLKKTDSIDSAGIGALIYVSSTLKKLNCPLVIIAPEGPILDALEVSGLKGYFAIASTLKEAVSLVAAQQN